MELALFTLLLIFTLIINSRLSKLEKILKDQQQPIIQASVQTAAPQNTFTPSQIPEANPAAVYKSSKFEDGLVRFFKEDFLVKLGGLLLLLAMGWFVSYAITNNWIGPAGQITIGLLIGVVLLAIGAWRISKQTTQGAIFTALGGAAVLLTIFAAREVYDFFTPLTALIIMFVAVLYVTFVSVRYKRESLAIAGLLLGIFAPLLTSAPTPDLIGLYSYLLVVVLGTLWVVWKTGWTNLVAVAITAVFFYELPLLMDGVSEVNKSLSLMFAFVFVAVFFMANIVSMMRRIGDVKHKGPHIYVAFATAIYLLSWVIVAGPKEWQSLLFATWAIVFGLASYAAYRFSSNVVAFYVYTATALALIGAATAAELSGPTLTIALTLEISALIIAAIKLKINLKLLVKVSLLFIIPILLSLESITASSGREGIAHSDFAVLVILTLSLITSAFALYEYEKALEANNPNDRISRVLFIMSGVYAVTLLWLSTHALMSDMLATLLSLVVYTTAGIAFFVKGKLDGNKTYQITGGILIGLTVARLLLVDVWDMNLSGRIVTFFIIGVMLLSTAFIKQSPKIKEDKIPS